MSDVTAPKQNPGQKFEDLARRLLAVPKAQVDEAREKAKTDRLRKQRKKL